MLMRTVIFFFILLITLRSPSFTQASPHLPEPDKDPFVGTWKANADKSRPKHDKVDASYVRTISRDGDDRIISSRMKRPGPPPLIKGKNYSEFFERHYRIRCDGLPHPVPCGVGSCTTSCTYKGANRVEGETRIECPKGENCRIKADRQTQYWTDEVSADGQEMTISIYEDNARTRLESIQVLDHVK